MIEVLQLAAYGLIAVGLCATAARPPAAIIWRNKASRPLQLDRVDYSCPAGVASINELSATFVMEADGDAWDWWLCDQNAAVLE